MSIVVCFRTADIALLCGNDTMGRVEWIVEWEFFVEQDADPAE
jgi:hypothetical protein